MKYLKAAALLSLLASVTTAHADFFGTLSGRSANPANNPQQSVEGSFSISSDYDNIGARYNYTLNERLSVYGDVGLSDVVNTDGTSFGAGFFYYLPNLSNATALLNTVDVAVQGSFHTADLDIADATALGVAFLFSPKQAFNPDNGLNWYANVGFTRLTFDVEVFDFLGNRFEASSNDTELQIGGGAYLPIGPGTLYAGADLIDEFIIGVGYRYGF